MSHLYPSKFTNTKINYFKSKLDESKDLLDNELETKIINQFELFINEYEKICAEYNLKNYISFSYIRDKLINLNKTNQEFTKISIKIETDLIQDELIHQSLLNKSIIILISININNKKITTFLFNKTCVSLGWFFLSNNNNEKNESPINLILK